MAKVRMGTATGPKGKSKVKTIEGGTLPEVTVKPRREIKTESMIEKFRNEPYSKPSRDYTERVKADSTSKMKKGGKVSKKVAPKMMIKKASKKK